MELDLLKDYQTLKNHLLQRIRDYSRNTNEGPGEEDEGQYGWQARVDGSGMKSADLLVFPLGGTTTERRPDDPFTDACVAEPTLFYSPHVWQRATGSKDGPWQSRRFPGASAAHGPGCHRHY